MSINTCSYPLHQHSVECECLVCVCRPVKPPREISLQEEIQQLKAIVHDVRECQMLTAQNTAKEIAALKAQLDQEKCLHWYGDIPCPECNPQPQHCEISGAKLDSAKCSTCDNSKVQYDEEHIQFLERVWSLYLKAANNSLGLRSHLLSCGASKEITEGFDRFCKASFPTKI